MRAPWRCPAALRADLADRLHATVPPDRWCITKEDLKQLRLDVYHDIQRGHIRATETDDFKSHDQVYGPSIYTVTEQHIKPVTYRAGRMSWALMMHPKGLECHVFISHAWEEGFFEFLKKVRHSWPARHHHAWCCMLANPQNLNIASLLQSPSSSPFALALRASRTVLVVPNRHRSVYTRLWCAYEAYLAQSEGKPIAIACAPMAYQRWRSLRYLCFAGAFGILLGSLVRWRHWHWFRFVLWLPSLLAMLGLALQENENSFLLHCFCEMLCWMEVCNFHVGFPTGAEWGFPDSAYFFVHLCFWLMASSFFFMLEVDRVHLQQSRREATKLRKGYQGSIKYAECTQAEDAQRILGEIGDKVQHVDFAIHVLLSAGMSSPSLRDIAVAGVDIEHAVYSEFTAAVILLGPFDILTVGHLLFDLAYEHEPLNSFLLSLSIVLRMLLLSLILLRDVDERCFLLKILSKLVALLIIAFMTVYSIAVTLLDSSPVLPWIATFDAAILVAVSVGILGMSRLKRCQLGLCLLSFIFARGKKVFWSCCYGPACEASDSESTSP